MHDQPFEPGPPPDVSRLSIRAWNMLGGKVDWAGIELVAEVLGIQDVEALIFDLLTIRDRNLAED